MNKSEVIQKFADNYAVNERTFKMGAHHELAAHIARRFAHHRSVLDACVGAGMLTIALARNAEHIIAVDIDPEHLEQARRNAIRAGVADKCTFVCAEVLTYLSTTDQEFDAAFLDPDWTHSARLDETLPPIPSLMERVLEKTPNICLRVSRDTDLRQIEAFSPVEIEPYFLKDDLKFYCAWFGDLPFEK